MFVLSYYNYFVQILFACSTVQAVTYQTRRLFGSRDCFMVDFFVFMLFYSVKKIKPVAAHGHDPNRFLLLDIKFSVAPRYKHTTAGTHKCREEELFLDCFSFQ